MKKTLALALCLALVITTFTGCGTKKEEKPVETPAVETPAEETPETDSTAAVKTGLAIISSLASSKDASAEEGLAQVDSNVVAVIVDGSGKILDCAIDAAQTKIAFSSEGKITTDLATVFKSKQDLGTEYGLAKASAIGKEWNEQATALAEYAVGKTVDEIKGIALNEKGATSDADLSTSVTISIAGYINAIVKAVENAKDLGATEGDKLGLAVFTTIAKSADATADAEGVAQAYSNYGAITTNADGKITSTYIDASQSEVKFSTTGVISTDLASELKTKQELGADYGMAKASSISKEWFEQVNALAEYVVGKTAEEVKGIALTEDGVPTDADLASSVTIKIGDYVSIIDKAYANATK